MALKGGGGDSTWCPPVSATYAQYIGVLVADFVMLFVIHTMYYSHHIIIIILECTQCIRRLEIYHALYCAKCLSE